jgi:hypothetical protein
VEGFGIFFWVLGMEWIGFWRFEWDCVLFGVLIFVMSKSINFIFGVLG